MSTSEQDRRTLQLLGILLRGETWPSQGLAAPSHAHLRRHHLRALAHVIGLPELRESYCQIALLAAIHERTLGELASAFAARGLPWTPVKGAAYARTIYAEPAHRPMSDLDVLVPASDFDRAIQILEGLGYRQRPVSSRTRHAQTLMRATHEVIDLHRSMLQPMRASSQLSDIWARADGRDPELGFVVLDPIDHLVLHVAHMARHEFIVPLVSFVDFTRLHEDLSAAQRKQLLQRLQRARLGYAFRALWSLTARLRGGQEPRMDRRTALLLPSPAEQVAGRHRDRRTQLARKFLIFPRDAPALLAGWAIRQLEDRLTPGEWH